MINAVEIDKQTTSFVRQLEEQRRIEKNLMVERVRGAKEGLESVYRDIQERVDALERMTGSVSTSYIAPVGWSQLIFGGADSVSSPNTISFGDRDDTVCKHDQIRYLEDTNYLRLSANPHYVEHVLPINRPMHERPRTPQPGTISAMCMSAIRPCSRFPPRWSRRRSRSCRG